MSRTWSRRQLLSTVGSTAVISTAGCSGTAQDLVGRDTIGKRNDSSPDEWATLGQNLQNTKFNPGGSGPKEKPSIEWTYDQRGILTPPTITEESVAVSGIETLSMLNLDGSERWTIDYPGYFDERRSYPFPVVITENLICSTIRPRTDAPVQIVAYTHSGDRKWEFSLGAMVGLASTPFVGYDSGLIFVSLGGRYERVASPGIVALDAETGDPVWSRAHEYSFTYPVVTEQVVISQSNELIQAYERGTGELLWEFDTLESRITRPVVAGKTVYVQYGNETVGLDLMDGSLKMEATEEFGGEFAFVEDVVIESDDDTLRGYHVEHETVLWEREYAATLSPPAIADGVAYVGGEDKQLRGIEISSGEELWSHQLNDDVRRPVVAQERVLAVSGDTLYSFR